MTCTLATIPGTLHAGQSGAQQPDVAFDTADLRRTFLDEVAQKRAPGAVLAVVIGNRVQYVVATGVCSAETRQPVSPETLFRVGSVTKAVTAATVLSLDEADHVSLSVPIGRYVPGLTPAIGRLTMQQLLTHTAGLSDGGSDTGPHDEDALGRRVRRWGQKRFFTRPGDVYSYSSPGYWLAGFAGAARAHRPYTAAAREQVLDPLGMKTATFSPLMALTRELALDHVRAGDSVVVVRPLPDDASTWPAGSLFASVLDLSQFAIALLNDGVIDGHRVLTQAVVDQMTRPQVPIPGGDCSYTYGLTSCRQGGVTVLSHYGYRRGSGAVFTLVPARHVAVIILSNVGGGILSSTESRALALAAHLEAPPPDTTRPLTRTVPRAVLGVYANGTDTLRLLGQGSSAVYRYGGTDAPIAPTSDGGIAVLDSAGGVSQTFMVIRRSGNRQYLHDGLIAYRCLGPAHDTRRADAHQ